MTPTAARRQPLPEPAAEDCHCQDMVVQTNHEFRLTVALLVRVCKTVRHGYHAKPWKLGAVR